MSQDLLCDHYRLLLLVDLICNYRVLFTVGSGFLDACDAT